MFMDTLLFLLGYLTTRKPAQRNEPKPLKTQLQSCNSWVILPTGSGEEAVN
jgi:hypothetical protein